MIKAVIFDLDGTLVDSIKDIAVSMNSALEKYNLPIHSVEKYKYFVGNGVPKLVERAIPKEELNEQIFNDVHKAFSEYYRENLDNTTPFDGIIDSLNTLKSRGMRLALISNKRDVFTQSIAKNLFGDFFDIVLGNNDEYPLKPNPVSTLAILKEFGILPCETVFLGDSGVDMETAVNSGCFPVGVAWGLRTEQELLESGAKHILHSPSEIAPFILGV